MSNAAWLDAIERILSCRSYHPTPSSQAEKLDGGLMEALESALHRLEVMQREDDAQDAYGAGVDDLYRQETQRQIDRARLALSRYSKGAK